MDEGFALLRRDSADLHLWAAEGDGDVFIPGRCRIEADPVGELFEEMGEAGVLHPASGQGPRETERGTPEFDVIDLEGNRITFFQELPETGRAPGTG